MPKNRIVGIRAKKPHRNVKSVRSGKALIKSTSGGTVVTITDRSGALVSRAKESSDNRQGAKGAGRSAPQKAAEIAARRAKARGMKNVDLFLTGLASGHQTAIKSLTGAGLKVRSIRQSTSGSHSRGTADSSRGPGEGSVDELLDAVVDRIREIPASTHLAPRDIARAVTALGDALPDSSSPEQEFGPFYTSAGLMRRWKVSRQAINAKVQRRTLLGLPASDGSTLFPSFQFADHTGRLEVLAGFADVVGVLSDGGAGPMMIASWLSAPQPSLDGASALDRLRQRKDLGLVLALARSDAARWRT